MGKCREVLYLTVFCKQFKITTFTVLSMDTLCMVHTIWTAFLLFILLLHNGSKLYIFTFPLQLLP